MRIPFFERFGKFAVDIQFSESGFEPVGYISELTVSRARVDDVVIHVAPLYLLKVVSRCFERHVDIARD